MQQILRRQLNAIHDYGLLLAPDGTILYANPAAQQVWDLPEDGGGRHVMQLHPEYAHAAARAALEKVSQGDLPRFELDCHDRDGVSFRVEITAIFIPNDEGGIIQSFIRNLSQVEHASNLLQNYDRMLSSTSVLVSLVSPDFRYLAVNDEYLRFFGCERNSIVGRPIAVLHGEDKAARIRETLQECLQGRALATAHPVARADGSQRYMESWQAPARDEQGRIVGVVVTSRDATRNQDLRAAVLRIARSQALKQGDLERTAREVCTSVGEVLSLPLVEVWLSDEGGTPRRLVSRSEIPADPPSDLPTLLRRLSEEKIVLGSDVQLHSGLVVRGMESKDLYAAIRRSGEAIGFLRLTTTGARRMWHPDELQLMQEVVDLLGEAVMVQNQQQLEDQLLAARRLESLGLLAGGMTHDFNNLLTGIVGNLEEVARVLPSEHPGLVALQLAQEGGRRASALCRQVLADESSGSTIDLEAELRTCVDLLRAGLPAHVAVDVDLALDGTLVELDCCRLHQVLANLVTNAADAYGSSGGQIHVTAEAYSRVDDAEIFLTPTHAGPFVCVQVQDQAGGMAGDVSAQVFNPFYSTRGAGRGLGLATVHEIMRGLGGGIALHSTNGVGTCVRVYLPCAEASTNQEQSVRILVVDDEEIVRTVAARILESAGYVVDAHETGQAALDQVQQGVRYGVAMVDLRMPEMDGLTFLQRLREIAPETQAVLCSGYAEETLVEAARTLRGVHLLSKPYAANDLTNAVQRALQTAD